MARVGDAGRVSGDRRGDSPTWDAFTQNDAAAVRAWMRVAVVEPYKLYNVIGYVSRGNPGCCHRDDALCGPVAYRAPGK
jgi:hypothetical protein